MNDDHNPAASAATPPEPDALPPWTALRLLWVSVEIILVLWFGQQGVQFVYQGF